MTAFRRSKFRRVEGQIAFEFAAEPAPQPSPAGMSADDFAVVEQAVRAAVGSTILRHGVARSDDLEQQGWLEGLRAWQKFDPSRGVKLGAHVCGFVKLRLIDWLRAESPLSRKQIAENQQARREGRELPWHPVHASFDASSISDYWAQTADRHAEDAFDAVDDRLVGSAMIADARRLFAGDARLSWLFEHVVLGGNTSSSAAQHLGLSPSRIEQLLNRDILPALRARFALDAAAA